MLASCGTVAPQIVDRPVIVEKPVYPNIPQIPYPDPIQLGTFKWDYPRDSSGKVDLSSNVFIGLSEADYKKLVEDWNALVSRNAAWKNIVDQENEFLKKLSTSP